MGSCQVAKGNPAGLQLCSFTFKKYYRIEWCVSVSLVMGLHVRCLIKRHQATPPRHWPGLPPPFSDSCKTERWLQTVEQESWAWWMSSKCGLIPWGVAGGGGWPSWWHLMECGAFYLWDVNLSADLVEWKPTSTELKPVCRVGMHSLPVWSLFPHPQPFWAESVAVSAGGGRQRKQMGILSLSWRSQTRQKLSRSLWMGRNTPLICVQVIPR